MGMHLNPLTWQLWGYVILAWLMCMVVLSDLLEHRIPNAYISIALLLGLALNTFGPANGHDGLLAYFPGALGFWPALWGGLIGLLLFLPLYFVKAMGAGDVKLMMALGVFVGPVDALNLALCVLIIGGALSLVRMLASGTTALVVHNLKGMWTDVSHGQAPTFNPLSQSAERMPYALAFACGLLAYGWWRQMGGLPLIRF